ncbi:MAG: protein phosphatase 2C domain-containing protein [Ketobacteraceae bacterium]|nr:protein phosphatase 2C domain-containing protein [Ketobacteraceae bacterium]
MDSRLTAFSATQSHTGHQRRVNEDAAHADARQGLWVVADGMGGYAAGDVASRAVVHSVSRAPLTGSLDECADRLEDAIVAANRRLLFETTLPAGCQHIGTTVTVLYFHPEENTCVCLWVGDSRLYVLRNNGLYQMTRDHSVVQEMVDSGLLDEASRDSHPQSHVITRAVGVTDDLVVDRLTFTPQPGDLYLLCSDGLYNEICLVEQLQALGTILSGKGALKSRQMADSLVEAVLGTAARDNITVTVVSMEQAVFGDG